MPAPVRLALPELDAFHDEPAQMPSGAPGKSGRLRLGFERRGPRTVLADLASRAPYLAQRALHCDEALPDMATVFVVATSGCVLQGDRLALEIALGPGARAHVTTQSATKVHAMDANHAAQLQRLVVEDGAYLEYMPEPLITHRDSRFVSETEMVVAPGASLIATEIVQPGRRHHRDDECFGMTLLSLAARAVRPDGTLLFAERLVVGKDRASLRQAGVMQGFDVFANVFVVAPPDVAARVMQRQDAGVDLEAGVAWGACSLPNDAGLVFKVVARETAQARAKVAGLWAIAREEITGAGVPGTPFWR